MRTHTIAICGAGIGGLACAIALDARGHQITIFEKIETPLPIGSGLMLQPTGQAALARLGLLEPVLDLGQQLTGIRGQTASGRQIFDINYNAIGDRIFGLGLHRGALFHVLDAERRRRNINTLTNANIATSGVSSNKRVLADSAGHDRGAFDLVIDASGLHSVLRQQHATIRLNRPYPYGAVWGVVREPEHWPEAHILAQRYEGAHKMAGLLPIGRAPGQKDMLTAFFWSLKTADFAQWRAQPFADWQSDVIALWPDAEPFVTQFKSHSDLAQASYADVWLREPFAERLAFVGDSARAASPQLGQGANLALIDAVVLADCLDEHPMIADALAAYAKRRHAHTRFYGLASRWLTPFFQSDSRIAGSIRDSVFQPMARVPFLKQEMVRTLAGLKTGLLSHQTPTSLVGGASKFSTTPVT